MRTETKRETYLNDLFGHESAELARLRDQMAADGVGGMSIGPHEARLLQFLIRGFRLRTIVEIGTLAGYSALAMAAALPANGRVVTIESDRTRFEKARATFAASALGPRIEALHGPALDVLERLDGPFDAVFIDANKREYPKYLDWAERTLRRDGLIVGDNTFLWGGVYGEPTPEAGGVARIEAMKEFNRRLADSSRYCSTMIPTAEGMTVARKLFD